MFKNLGKLKYLIKKKELKISLNELKSGINFFESFIIYQDNKSLKIYDRKCDHAGGKIISKNGNAICPIHMWKFNPATGFYDNGVKKKEKSTPVIFKKAWLKNLISVFNLFLILSITGV